MRAVCALIAAGVVAAAAGCGGSQQAAAPSDFSPRLRVEQRPGLPGRATSLLVDVSQDQAGPPLGPADIVVPRGFRIALPRAGRVGAAETFAAGGDAVRGTLTRTSTTACGGGVTAAAGAGGSTLTVSVRMSRGRAHLAICPPAHVRRFTVRLDRGLVSGPGDLVWRGLFTTAGRPSSQVESRAIVATPSFLTIEPAHGPRVATGSTVQLRGYLLQGEASPHRNLRILAGPSVDRLTLVGRARTHANGGWTFALPVNGGARRLFVVARAQSVEQPCPGACATATLAGTSSSPLQLAVGR